MNRTHLDFETHSTADLRKTGAHAYAEHPDTDAWCAAWAVNDDEVDIFDRDNLDWDENTKFAWEFRNGGHFVAHNAQFELSVWNSTMVPKHGWPEIQPERFSCTMAMAYALSLPGSLENAAAAVGLKVGKDMQGRNLMLKLARPKKIQTDGTVLWNDTKESLIRLYSYCKNDVIVERELEKRLLDLSQDEQQTWWLDQRINNRGVCIDIAAMETAIKVVDQTKKNLDSQMRKTTGGWVTGCTKVAALVEWLSLKGIETEGVAKENIAELLARDDLPPEVRRAIELRRDGSKSSTAKLKSMRFGASEDGRCRGTLQYHGAGTGRWAGRRVQFQNVPRPEMKQYQINDVLETLRG